MQSYRLTGVPAATKPPGTWRRVITGIIGVPLLIVALLPIWIAARSLPGALSGDDCGFFALVPCSELALDFGALGGGMALVGVPFAIASFVPFGTFRRVMVGVGVAAIGGIIFAVALTLYANGEEVPDGIVLPWAAAVALPVAAGFFYPSYRIAR